MEEYPLALLKSPHLKCWRALVRMLEGIRVNHFASTTLAEGEEVLSHVCEWWTFTWRGKDGKGLGAPYWNEGTPHC